MDLGFDPVIFLRLNRLQRLGVGAALVVLVAAIYGFIWFGDRQARIESLTQKISDQERKIVTKRSMLKKLPKLHRELEELRKEEAEALLELPSKQEIPTLLTQISHAGHEQGLEFLLFQPKPEVPIEFYAEVPISLGFRGQYHQAGLFLDRLSRLPRIVGVVSLAMVPDNDNKKLLRITADAVTYRYLGAPELLDNKKKGKKKRKKRKARKPKRGKK
ncbi:MAG: type 4a pilus biogenesis protein PilO [Magnetococcales bacterium]|nr:type 4a pilus biogenesis protein PilO [Magnetococcales bacterium]